MHAVKTKRRINLSAVVAVSLFAILLLAGMISRNTGEKHKETPPERNEPSAETALAAETQRSRKISRRKDRHRCVLWTRTSPW